MADVKVKVVTDFRDRTADLQLRKKNETLTVSEERAKKLEGLGLVKRVKDEPKASETTKKAVEKKG